MWCPHVIFNLLHWSEFEILFYFLLIIIATTPSLDNQFDVCIISCQLMGLHIVVRYFSIIRHFLLMSYEHANLFVSLAGKETLRCLALACKQMPSGQQSLSYDNENNLTFIGLVCIPVLNAMLNSINVHGK